MSAQDRTRLDSLRSIAIFENLDDAALGRIVERMTEFEVTRGHVLIQPNQPGEGLFLIEDGSVLVELPNRKSELGPGEFFGELALLTDSPRTARVSAVTDLRCLALRRDDFDLLLEEHPRIAISMLRVLAKRLAKA